jgi:methyl-accepting chemotaxis protein
MKNVGIGKKIALGLSLVGILMVAVAGSGYWGLNFTERTIQGILAKDYKLTVTSLRVRNRILDLRGFEKDYELNMGDKKAQEECSAKWSESLDDVQARIQELDKLATSDQDKAIIQEMQTDLADYVNGFREMKAAIDAGTLTRPQDSNRFITKYKDAIHRMEDTSQAFGTEKGELMAANEAVIANVKLRT